MKRAFTLIELLIALIIIGIVVTIAIPQYQKAVDRAKLQEMKIVLRTLSNAIERYYLAYGEWPGNPDIPDDSDEIPEDLGVTVPESKYFHYNVHYHVSPLSPGGHAKVYYKGEDLLFGCRRFECNVNSDGARRYEWTSYPDIPDTWHTSEDGWLF